MRSTKVLPLLTVLAASLPAQWLQISSLSPPGQRRAAAMAFHPGTNQLIMYGGLAATPSQVLNDTWRFGANWLQLNPPGSTPPRWGHQMVTNTATGAILTFGGRSPNISGLANDTMEWNGISWVNVPTPSAPSPRFLYGMAYDSNRNVTVLFGGRDNSGANDETWEFDGVTWSQVATFNSPAPREEMGMVFDASRNRTILFGGCDEGSASIYGDTWEYNGNDWTEVTPANSPTARFRGIMEYDSNRSRTVYFGGFDGTQQRNETFEYAGGQWDQVPTGGNVPTSLTEMASAYNPNNSTITTFGGFGNSFSNDTWQFTGDTSGLFTLYGEGCDTSAGSVDLAGTTPNIGSTLTLTYSNLGSAPALLIVLGLSDQQWNGLPLPLDLGIINLTGCNLLASGDFIDLALVTNSTVNYDLAIPLNNALVNNSVYTQGVAFTVAPLSFEGTSRGGRALIGQ